MEARVERAQKATAAEKAKGDRAVAKLSRELRAEKEKVKDAKKEADKDIKKSLKVERKARERGRMTAHQVRVKQRASLHVEKAKAKVAKGYIKMRKAEDKATHKVHNYQRVKQSLLSAEASEMRSKQIESRKLSALAKSRAIEKKQEKHLAKAKEAAAEATRNALDMAFRNKPLTAGGSLNPPMSPHSIAKDEARADITEEKSTQKELDAALSQEKTEAQEISTLKAMEQSATQAEQKMSKEVSEGAKCAGSAGAAASYNVCFANCNKKNNWQGSSSSCKCWECRKHLDAVVAGSCSCDPKSNKHALCSHFTALRGECTSKCVDQSRRCACGRTHSDCCSKHLKMDCKSGFLWNKQCHLGHPNGFTCKISMTSKTLALVVGVSLVMAAVTYGCMPTLLAWYCCVRDEATFNWLLGGSKVYAKDDGL